VKHTVLSIILLAALCGTSLAEVGDIFVSDEEYRAYKAAEAAKAERYVDPLVKAMREHNRAMDEWEDGKKSPTPPVVRKPKRKATAMFLALTNFDGSKVWINPSHVTAFYQGESGTVLIVTTVMGRSDKFTVKESAEAIARTVKCQPPK
jgi:hypothetical protein